MKIITIDWGSYSAKIFESELDKKTIHHLHIEEIVFINKSNEQILIKWEKQLEQIQTYIKNKIHPDDKIILSTPSELLSFRYKNLPILQRKKAIAMLPFQIEDDIPFNLHETYLATTFLKQKKSFDAFCYFAKKETFQKCLDIIIEKEVRVNYWLHPIDPLALFAQEARYLNEIGSTCLLDIGHETTKAYFFKNKKFHSYQISHFGGSRIDEMMSTIYQLSYEQLQKFKHESAFIVPKELFSISKLNDDQKFFAENMDNLFFSFVQEFKRWEMSFRVDTKEKVSQIYLIGGTSLIKNIDQYLSFYWERPVQVLSNSGESFQKLKHLQNKNSNFLPGDLLSIAHKMPNKMTNHLGKISFAWSRDPLPLYSLSFVGLRSLIFTCLFLILGFTYVGLLLNKEKLVDNQLKIISQNVQLDLSTIDKSQLFNSPETSIKKIEIKLKQAKNDILRINKLNHVSSLKALKSLQTALLGTSCHLSKYESFENNNGVFEIEECNIDNTKKISNILAKEDIKFKIKSSNNNQITGSF